MVKFIGSKKIDLKTIKDFEEKNSLTLPEIYRNFLFENNGSYPNFGRFKTLDNKECSVVDTFLGLGVEEYKNLDFYWSIYKSRIPNGFFPIAFDPGGNLILLTLDEERKMSGVYFWDHEKELESSNSKLSSVTKIAHSLDSFINILFE